MKKRVVRTGHIARMSAALLPAFLLAGCIPDGDIPEAFASVSAAQAREPLLTRPLPAPEVARPETPAQRSLAARIRALGQAFNGDVGIAVREIDSGWTTAFDGDTLFPQQSVSKFWVALTALDAADRGSLNLGQSVTLTRADLTLFHQPIRELIGSNGYTTTLNQLLFRAITQSDNTANDYLLRRAGGPEAVRDFLERRGIDGVRFGPGERLMQSQLAGLTWRPEYSLGRAFYTARANVPASARRAAFERYISDPVDGAKPRAVVTALARLHQGDLLSPASTRRLLDVMSQTRTGRQRLTGGLASGWRIAHKTGTGQVLNGEQTGYNDIGIITSPGGDAYAVAVMIRRTSAPVPARMELMQDTVRAVINYDRDRQVGGGTTLAR